MMVTIRTPAGPIRLESPTPAVVKSVRRGLAAGGRTNLARLPDGTPFQQACWRAARSIPAGQTRSYLWLAERALKFLGEDPARARGCARAAGQAMRRNPWPVVIPCHRVISSNGTLGGFSGATDPRSRMLRLKRWLLAREGWRAPGR